MGTVWGPDDRPVAGVPIKIQSATGKKAKWELVSDRQGEFAQRVPVGRQDYTIQAEVKTPKGEPKPEITVQIEDNERKDVSLHLKQVPGKK
jgi:predicted nucleotidyltransferase